VAQHLSDFEDPKLAVPGEMPLSRRQRIERKVKKRL
jgi:hypothetical protein